jgi:hypothetical protein
MKRHAYFLILLFFSAQVDDGWAVAPVLPSAPAPLPDDDNDEYLPTQRRLRDEQTASQEPAFVGHKPESVDFPLARGGVPSEWSLTTPFMSPPLYVFMCLQI